MVSVVGKMNLLNLLEKILIKSIYKMLNEVVKHVTIPKEWENKRSIYDKLLTLQTIIDDNKNHKKDTYILIADAEKCLDRLWLDDACNEISEIRFTEVELIIKVNSKAIVAIDTPVGYTNKITLHDIVR